MVLDTSDLEATMDAAAIANGIKNRGVDQLSIERIQELMVHYERAITSTRQLPYGMSGTSVDAVPMEVNQEQLDRMKEKYFLMQKYLDTVM